MLPSTGFDDRLTPPYTGGSVEIDEAPRAVATGLLQQQVTIEYDASRAHTDQFREAIKDAGFEVEN